ncbi:MAG: PKD domain-containing protein [Bacteroidota bacterium]
MDLTPTGVGNTQTSACIYGGEYNTFTACAGAEYTITTCGDPDFDTQLTIYEPDGVTVAGYSDDYVGCSPQSEVTFTASVDGVYDIVLDQFNCISNSICMTLSVTQNTACSGGSVSNDDPCDAISLTVGGSCTYSTYTSLDATNSGVADPGCASYSGGDVWFSATVPASGHLIIDTDFGVVTDGGMAIYSGNCSSLTFIECDDDDSPNGLMPMIDIAGLTPGSTIWIRFWEYGNNNNGTFNICVYDGGSGGVSNDDPCDAEPLSVGSSCIFSTYSNEDATSSSIADPGCASYSGGDVWFSTTVPASGHLIIDTDIGVVTDGGMAIYSGTCSSLTLIECDDDDSNNGMMPMIDITGLTPGSTIWIRFWEYGSDNNGTFDICVYDGGTSGPVTAGDCQDAINVCTDLGFQIDANGFGAINEIPPLGSLGNPDNNNPGGSGNWGCLRADELNSTWMILNIGITGLLEFTFGGNVTQAGFYDWIMYPWTPTSCTDIPNNTVAPVRCNWNGVDWGGTGLASSVPPGGDPSNYEPPLSVECSEKYIIVFSNYSSAITDVPLEFYGTATVECLPLTCEGTALCSTGGSLQPEQDCINAIPVCQNIFCQPYAYEGEGANPTEIYGIGPSCMDAGEKNDVWYTFTVISGGNLSFLITPDDLNDDYDWAVYNLTNNSCADIYSNSGLEVSCNWAADPGATGPNGGSGLSWQDAFGTPLNATIPVSAGQTYVLNVSNWTSSQSGYVLDFSASTAVIFDDVEPIISSLSSTPTCGATSITFNFSENVLCSTVDACDFTVTGPQATTVTGVTSVDCSAGGTQDNIFTVTVSPPLTTTGSYNLNLVSGCAYVEDLCGNIAPPGNLPFTLTGITAGITSSNNVTCNGTCNGSATATGSGGSSPYTYSWSPSGGTGQIASNLCPNTYTVTVTDANGCSAQASTTITEPTPISINVSSTDETCSGACDGTVSASASGGVGGYTYTWSGGLGSGANKSNVCPNTYTVTVTDNNGCTSTANVTVNPGTVVNANFTYNGNQCAGNSFNFTNTGTTGVGVTYSWTFTSGTPATSTAQNPSGITWSSPGTYNVTLVTTLSGCSDNITIVITVYDPPTASITGTDESCPGACDGSANLSVVLGDAFITNYSWSNGAFTEDINNLCPGLYTVTVTDANGCQTTASVTINPGVSNPTASFTYNSDQCLTGNSFNFTNTGTSAGVTYSWTFTGGSPATSTAQNPSGITWSSANTYSVTLETCVAGNPTCCDITSQTIEVFAEPSVTVTGTNLNCNGVCDGTVSATPSGGALPYTYSWDNGAGTNQTASGLCAITYTVTVTDANGCTATDNITLTEPPLLTANITLSNDPTCNGASDGSATVAAGGGTGAFTYSWSPAGGSGATATGLSGGILYTVTVTDANGCSATDNITLTDPPLLTANITSSNDPDCNGGSNGTATVTAGGGTGVYTYSWSPSGGTGTTGTGLSAGVLYTVTVTDANGCTATDNITLTDPALLTANITSSNNPDCNGSSDGDATVTAAGGSGAYTYSWSPSGGTGATGTGLSGSILYTVTVTDANGCTTTDNITLTNPPLLTANITASNNPDCNGGSDGDATVTAGGGTGVYTYSWSPAGGTGTTGTGLSGGILYTVTVTDANGCTAIDNITLTDPPLLTANITLSNDPSCNGDNDGDATVAAGGGTGAFTYSWSPSGGTSATATGLSGGILYTVTVTDANGCTASDNITLTDPALLTASIEGTDVSCNGGSDGSANLTPGGGTLPYTFLWSNLETTEDISSLDVGSYTVTVTDNNGCTATNSVTINEPVAITFTTSFTQSTCGNNDGQACVDLPVSGGTPPYTFLWSTSETTNCTANNLFAGSYNVTVSDANGCTSTATVNVTDAGSPTVTITGVDSLDCFGDTDGQVTIAVSGGIANYDITWTSGPPVLGVPAGTYIQSGLGGGAITVTVTDSNGCVASSDTTIFEPSQLLTSITSEVDALCKDSANGQATVAATGGTPAYTYQWDASAGSQTTTTATGLTAGSYDVTVTDANGCSVMETAAINEPTVVTGIILGTDVSCNGGNDGTANLTPSGGTPGYIFSWTGPNGFNSGLEDISGLEAGTYDVTITDVNGCTGTAQIIITEPSAISLITSSVNSNCNQSDGEVSVSASGGTVAVDYTYLWEDAVPSTVGTSATVTGLPAGTYTITVTDDNGCIETETETISDQGGGNITVDLVTDVLCNGDFNGAIDITVTGGTPAYTYSWTGPNGFTSASEDISGLETGTYDLIVTDAVSCVITVSVNVNEFSALSLSSSQIDATCNGDFNGSINLNVSGGTTAYTYSWTGPNGFTSTSEDITGLEAGTYDVTVTDANNCVETAQVIITEPAVVDGTISVTDVSCNGGNNGAANLTPSGGTPGFIFVWTGPNGFNSGLEDITGLEAGTYDVTITDINGCTGTAQIIITEPSAIFLTTSSVNSNCNQSDGEVSVTASGGTVSVDYTYLWEDAVPSTVGTTATVTGLTAGTYTITVTDDNGCIASASATINDIPGGTATATVVANTSGAGICDGSALVTISGGTAPFTYLWDDTLSQTTATADSLCAGSYCVTVTDANGCVATDCITITEPGAILLTITGTDILCFGECTGEADLTVTGGISPYTYLWNPGGLTAEDIVNLCANTYTVTVTDSNSVTATASVTINEPAAALSLSATATDVTCNNGSNGAIDLTVNGGTPPYTYNWSTSDTTEDLTNLSAGTYSIVVTDNNGCTINESYTIDEPPAITLNTSKQDANCGQPDGEATVFASGGTGTYAYLWDDSGSQTTANATGLTAGTYTVTVTDSAGCTETSTVNISDIGGGTASTVVDNDASCNGDCDGQATVSIIGGTSPYTYLWDDPFSQTTATAAGLCAGTFNVSISDNAGCVSTASVTVSEPAILAVTTSGNDAACNGSCDGDAMASVNGGTTPYTYLWNDGGLQTTATATGLCAGTYNVVVSDSKGCDTTTSIIINEPAAIAVTMTYETSHCGQADGEATATPSNGTPPYSYQWNDPNTQTTTTATGLLAGGYTVTVTDLTGCTALGTVTVSDTAGPAAIISGIFDVSCPGDNDGGANVLVTDGNPPYTYLWNDPGSQTTVTATGLLAGIYTVAITDANGCVTTVTCTINEPPVLIASATLSLEPGCAGSCNGIAVVTVVGGSSPYSYLWDDLASQTTITADSLCDGTYGIIVTDSNGCSASSSVILSEPAPISLSITQTDASCAGACDGSATVTPNGGTPPYTYLWSNGITTQVANNLCADIFNITVTDDNSCTSISSVVIGNPDTLTAAIILEVGVACNGDCDGYAEVSGTGGTLPYTYLWSDGQTTTLAINLCAGTYTNDITDANGCSVSATATITEPAALTNIFTSIDANCNGNTTGEATANISGGTSPYTYLWNDGNLQTTATATGLIAGIYTILVTDTNGCSLTDNLTINEPVPVTLIISPSGANCGQSDGGACVTVASGVSPFTYLWDDSSAQVTACATGLSAGTYNILVIDATGCTVNNPVGVNDLGAPTLSIPSFGDAGCFGGCNGFATVLVSGGTPPYTYLWNDANNQTTATASGLCAGNYINTIFDPNGCTAGISVTIGEPTAINVVISSQTDASCNGIVMVMLLFLPQEALVLIHINGIQYQLKPMLLQQDYVQERME